MENNIHDILQTIKESKDSGHNGILTGDLPQWIQDHLKDNGYKLEKDKDCYIVSWQHEVII